MALLSSSTNQQRARLLEELRQRPVTTFDAHVKLDIPHPSIRILELRAEGLNIVTHRRKIDGHKKVADYVLLSGGG